MYSNKLLIDTRKVKKNLEILTNGKKPCIMVKANAYGIGIDIVKYLVESGYNFFGVSNIQEALELRKLSKKIEILIVSYINLDDLKIIRENNIQFTVYEKTFLNNLLKTDKFHLKFDTGMGRIGFSENDVVFLNNYLKKTNILPIGIYTHFPIAVDEQFTKKQIATFKLIVESFDFSFKYIHMHNTNGCLKYHTSFDNMVRPGLGIWGYTDLEEQFRQKLQPSLKLLSLISQVKNYQGAIGYDLTEYVDGKIITLPIGYNDGLNRNFTNYNIPNVGRIVGKVCMCQTMVLADTDFVKDQQITVFKNQELYQLSEYSNLTIYEIITSFSKRIEKIYL